MLFFFGKMSFPQISLKTVGNLSILDGNVIESMLCFEIQSILRFLEFAGHRV